MIFNQFDWSEVKEPATDAEVAQIEEELQVKLPEDFLEELRPYFGGQTEDNLVWDGLAFSQLLALADRGLYSKTPLTIRGDLVDEGRMPKELVPLLKQRVVTFSVLIIMEDLKIQPWPIGVMKVPIRLKI